MPPMLRKPKYSSQWDLFGRAIAADRPALVGLVFIALIILVSLTIPIFSPYDPPAQRPAPWGQRVKSGESAG